jgi:hypothetical protein
MKCRLVIILAFFAGGGLQAAASDPVERLDFFDNAGNLLYYVAFERDNTDAVTGRTVYDREGYMLWYTAIETDAQGRKSRETYYDFKDFASNVFEYTYAADTTGFAVTDKYMEHDDPGETLIEYTGSYNAGQSEGTFDFMNSLGAATHRLSYEFDGEGKVTKINVADASGALTHYVTPVYAVGAVHSPAQKFSQDIRLQQLSGGAVRLSFALTEPRMVSAAVFDLRGRLAQPLLERRFGSGRHVRLLKPALRGDGIYFLHVSAGGNGAVQKLRIVY